MVGRDLEHRQLTAEFRDKPVPEVLEIVAAALDLTVSGEGNRFTLSSP